MSRRKVKPPKAKAKPPAPPEFSIARALAPLSGPDEAALCAFVAESEKGLADGCLKGWRITRGNSSGESLTWLEVRTPEDEVIMEAVSAISKALIGSAVGTHAGGAAN